MCPNRDEVLPGSAAEQHVAGLGHRLGHLTAHHLVVVPLTPAAVREAAPSVLVRPAWTLHDAVERDPDRGCDRTHATAPSIRAPLSAPAGCDTNDTSETHTHTSPFRDSMRRLDSAIGLGDPPGRTDCRESGRRSVGPVESAARSNASSLCGESPRGP